MKDLVILVADKNMQFTLQGLLKRPQSLGIRPLTYDLFVHVRRDPGCLNEAHHFLRQFVSRYKYALVMFDYEGCGREQAAPDSLANEVKQRLEGNGWYERAEAVVLNPELEVWVWSKSPHVATCLGWSNYDVLREWLAAKNYWSPQANKPPHLKAAMEAALREVRQPRSSAIYLELAQKATLQGHAEPGFVRFTQALQKWFPDFLK